MPDQGPRPEEVGLEQQLGPRGVENGLCRGVDPVNFKVFVYDQEKVESSWGWFRSDKTAPNEEPAQLSVADCELQESPEPAWQPQASESGTTEARLELLPIRHVYYRRQFSALG